MTKQKRFPDSYRRLVARSHTNSLSSLVTLKDVYKQMHDNDGWSNGKCAEAIYHVLPVIGKSVVDVTRKAFHPISTKGFRLCLKHPNKYVPTFAARGAFFESHVYVLPTVLRRGWRLPQS